jgi:putative hydrolase of HD superfamily
MSSVGRLKAIPRSGWVSHGVGIQEVESVADHSYSTSTLAMFLGDMELGRGRRIDVERLLRLGLLHDLAEALTFDISKSYLEYLGREGEAIKREVEQAAWEHIIKGIEKTSIRLKYARLLAEFDEEETLEAQIVHAADRLDILYQIIEYHRRGYPKEMLADLWASTNRSLMHVRLSSVRKLRRIAVRRYKAMK